MKRFKKVHYLLCLTLLSGILGGLFGSQVVFAAQENSSSSFLLPPNQTEPPVEEEVEIITSFPVLSGKSGTSFSFEFQIYYQSSEPKIFEFSLTPSPGWEATVKRQFKENEPSVVAAMEVPGSEYPPKYTVFFNPLPGNLPEPGDYFVTLEVASGNLKDSIKLKAVVTEVPPTYKLGVVTTTGRLDTSAKAGEDNTTSIKLTNLGTGAIKDITFSSIKSEGWGITFSPDKIESLEPSQSQEVDVVITPPNRTIAGDYRVSLTARGAEASDSVALRIRVQTPTMWGGVGIGIIAGVIAGLVVLFRRLSRR